MAAGSTSKRVPGQNVRYIDAYDPIQFCHISPTKYLSDFAALNGAHLILAHLVESDKKYRNFYAKLNDGKYKIMDNSAFEMFKQGREMYDSAKLLDMAKACNADCIVMTDYPRQKSIDTIIKAKELAPRFKDAGFDTFFCPQSELGDLDDLMFAFEWALNNPDIDVIGVSILACPIALGVDERMEGCERNEAYRLQRYLSRGMIFQEMERRGLLDDNAIKRFHCLGMTDGPNEVALLANYHRYIRTWDSSAAVWAGLNGIQFDNSPTGLINGKFEREVDFNHSLPLTKDVAYNVMRNAYYINNMCKL